MGWYGECSTAVTERTSVVTPRTLRLDQYLPTRDPLHQDYRPSTVWRVRVTHMPRAKRPLGSQHRDGQMAAKSEVDAMTRARERCPRCGRRLVSTRFDTTFRLPDRSERLCFGIPGGLCEDCHQLYIDPELIELLDLGQGRCVFAIESDLVLQEQAWSSAE